MKINFHLIIALFMITSACSVQKKNFEAPVSDFFHPCINVDSADFFSIKENEFLKKEFGSIFLDTSEILGKQSIELFLLGQETFLHFNLNKGIWQNKTGGGAITFQSRYPDKFDSLILGWQQHYADSLYRKTVKTGSGDEVGEIAIFTKRDSLTPIAPSFYTVLLSFTRASYYNWGFSDSTIAKGVTMKQNMASWDSTLPKKLFKKINALYIQITEKELKNLKTAMKTVGYIKKGNSFVHAFNPAVYYTVTQEQRIPKYTKIEIELSKPVETKTLTIGNMYVFNMKGTKLDIVAR